jgi:2-hydroxychromene-2-carboxylate isomerase
VRVRVRRTTASLLTSARLRDAGRRLHALRRRLRSGAAVVHYFHQADDPYSHLMLQVLPAFIARYAIRLDLHLVPPPGDAAAPDRARLEAWSRRDAASLASATGLVFADPGRPPPSGLTRLADRALAAGFRDATAPESALHVAMLASSELWNGDAGALARLPMIADAECDAMLAAGSRLRARLGHYLGAMLYFEGEWYWGIDRLHYLERRLRDSGLARGSDDGPIVRMPQAEYRPWPATGHRPVLHFFCSLRSPYTYLAVSRVVRLAECHGAELRLRFVLPMVMRGLPVPRDKRLYILRDAKREAETLGQPFGRIVDPVGLPTERGLAVLHRAVAAGSAPAFLESFLRGVWADGLDAGSDAGLRAIAARAGLDPAFVTAALADESWRAVAQANREEMLALGLWGVPSFRVDAQPARWGQDRLWQVERDLAAATAVAGPR